MELIFANILSAKNLRLFTTDTFVSCLFLYQESYNFIWNKLTSLFHLNWILLICVESPKTQKTLFVRLRRKAFFQQTISWRQFYQTVSTIWTILITSFTFVTLNESCIHSFKDNSKWMLNSSISSNLIIRINFIHYIATLWWTLHKLTNFVVFPQMINNSKRKYVQPKFVRKSCF